MPPAPPIDRCTSVPDCVRRASSDLGSSRAYPPRLTVDGAYFGRDPAQNPMFHVSTQREDACMHMGGQLLRSTAARPPLTKKEAMEALMMLGVRGSLSCAHQLSMHVPPSPARTGPWCLSATATADRGPAPPLARSPRAPPRSTSGD